MAFATRDFSNALKYAEEVQNNTQNVELKNRALVLLCLIYDAMQDNSASQEYYSMIIDL